MKKKRKLYDLDKQERIVAALWDFAKDGRKSDGEVDPECVGGTLRLIMEIFGYGVVSLQ